MECICTASDKFRYHVNAIVSRSEEQWCLSVGVDFVCIAAVLEEQWEGFHFTIFRDVEHHGLLQLVSEKGICTFSKQKCTHKKNLVKSTWNISSLKQVFWLCVAFFLYHSRWEFAACCRFDHQLIDSRQWMCWSALSMGRSCSLDCGISNISLQVNKHNIIIKNESAWDEKCLIASLLF